MHANMGACTLRLPIRPHIKDSSRGADDVLRCGAGDKSNLAFTFASYIMIMARADTLFMWS